MTNELEENEIKKQERTTPPGDEQLIGLNIMSPKAAGLETKKQNEEKTKTREMFSNLFKRPR